MATMLAYVNKTKTQSKERLTFVKSASQLNISAEVDLKSSEFHSLRVDVKKFPLVFAAGAKEDGPLVIDYNFEKLGKLECNYIPKVIVISGINAARHAKEVVRTHGTLCANAWVGNRALKAMSITAADVSSNDLQQLLYKEVQKTYGKKSDTKSSTFYYTDAPYVVDMFIFENYAILSWQGQKFRQKYKFDNKTRTITLDGEMVPVVETYEDVAAGSYFDQGNRGTTQGGFDGRQNEVSEVWRDYGAPNSEANNPGLKLMLNVEESLRCYLAEILKGVWRVMYPSVAVTPPNMIHASIEANIAAREAKVKNFSAMDFLKWQQKKTSIKASEQFKIVKGELYGSEDFAYVGELRDISTWFVPIRTSPEIHAAMKLERYMGVPKISQKATKARVEAAMAAAGTHTSGKVKANNPHKFVMNADDPKSDMCKHCNRSSEHPIHKVK